MIRSLFAAFLFIIPLILNAQIHGPQHICAESVYTYFVDPVPGAQVYQWSVDNAARIIKNDTTSVDIYFPEPGPYTITLLVIDDVSTDTLITRVYAVELYIAEVEITEGCYDYDQSNIKYIVCEGSTTVITNYSNPIDSGLRISGEKNYLIGPGNQGQEISITWGSAGQGEVSYFIIDNFCYGFIFHFEILPKPEPRIKTNKPLTHDTLEVCLGEEIQFSNTGILGMNTQWDMGDGTVIPSESFSHSYMKAGNYTVRLGSSQICDCRGLDELVVKVSEDPAPRVDCINSVCPDTRQVYTAITNGNCNNYHWNISENGRVIRGGRTQDDFVEVIWKSGPDGIIELSVSDCDTSHCATVNTLRVPVMTDDGPVTGDAYVCSGEVMQYSAPYFPGTEYTWTVSDKGFIIGDNDRSTVTILWDDVNQAQTGEWVKVVYDNCWLECGGEDEMEVSIIPEIHIEASETVCQNSTGSAAAFAGFSTPLPATVKWQIENERGEIVEAGPEAATFDHYVDLPAGTYYWVAINSASTSYCNDTIRQEFQVIALPPKPAGILGETEVCPTVPYGFTTSGSHNYLTQWTIVDGNNTRTELGATLTTSFGMDPPYLIFAAYSDPQYPQCLSNADTLVIERVSDLEIETLSNACRSQRSTYEVRAIDGAQYNWELEPTNAGEIKRLAKNRIEVAWAESGPAQLKLDVCGIQITKNIEVHPTPSFSINAPSEICASQTTEITTDIPSADHNWLNIDDEIIGNEAVLKRGAGTYAVTVSDNLGCRASQSFTINGIDAPTVELSAKVGIIYCSNTDPIRLIASSNDGNTFEWYRNDTALNENGREINISREGVYQVVATNATGCSSASNFLYIQDCCPEDKCRNDIICDNPSFCPLLEEDLQVDIQEPFCNKREYTGTHPDLIIDSSVIRLTTVDGIHIATYRNNTAQHQFRQPGYYNIVFKGKLNGFTYTREGCGHTDIILDSIVAIADFRHNTICAGESMEFVNESSLMPGYTIESYQWNFGDPASGSSNTSTDAHPTHFYTKGGEYEVNLQITTSSGCVADITKTVKVQDAFEIDIAYDDNGCEQTAVDFNINKTLFDLQWEFGDPASGSLNTSDAVNALHTYENTGNYQVQLTGKNIAGCLLDTSFMVEIIENKLAGDISVDPGMQVCEGQSVQLSAPDGGVNWQWSSGESSKEITTQLGGQYDVLITDSFLCQYSPPPVHITVDPKPRIKLQGRKYIDGEPQKWADSLFVCAESIIELQVFGNGSLMYNWSTGESGDSVLFAPEGGDALDAGIHIIDVVGYNPVTNCVSDTAYFYIEVYENPGLPEIQLTNGSACAGDKNELEVKDPKPGHSYTWSNGQSGPSIEVHVSGNYDVFVTNDNGCSNVSNSTIDILDIPGLDLIPGGCFTKCDPAEVCLPEIEGVQSYEIYRNGILIDQGSNLPSGYTADQDGSYEIVIEGNNGCRQYSTPLNLELKPAVGSFFIRVWSDVNKDGVIDVGDTTIQGIAVQMNMPTSTNPPYEGESDSTGIVSLFDMIDENATAFFNKGKLSSEWEIVIDSISGQIQNCDDSVFIDLLLVQNCMVTGPEQNYTLCPGEQVVVADSTLTDTGSYLIHTLNSSGCDSAIQVNIALPDSGNIHFEVWEDVDLNGVISSRDTLIPNININVRQGGILQNVNSGNTGSGDVDLVAGTYVFSIDTTHSNEYDILTDSLTAQTPCSQDSLRFLLSKQCEDILIDSTATICRGDTFYIDNQSLHEEGMYTYVRSGFRCDTILELQLFVIDADYQIKVDSCFNSALEFLWLENFDYKLEWSTGDTTDRIDDLQSGRYTFTINYAGCEQTDSIYLNSVNIDEVGFTPKDPACPGENSGMIIKSNDNHGLYWGVDSNILQQGDTLMGLSAGEYMIYLSHDNCHTQLPFFIDLIDPTLDPLELPEDLLLSENEAVQLTHNYSDSTDHTFLWIPAALVDCPDCAVTQFTGSPESVWIYLEVETPAGCLLSDSMFIEIQESVDEDPATEIYAPNVFTPNNDGNNDIFSVIAPLDHKLIRLSIYDRWGTIIYEELNPSSMHSFEGWDGTYKGKELVPAVFVYQIEYTDGAGERKTKEGTVYLD